MTKDNKLPEFFYEGIRLAVEDMKKCEADPSYKIDMRVWHDVFHDGCYVCMAGSVMAKTLNVPVTIDATPNYIEGTDSQKLHAFNFLREDKINNAYVLYTGKGLDPSYDEQFDKLYYVSYEDNKELFYDWCLKVADVFEFIETGKRKLPKKFSEGILLAIADMQACSKSKKYTINMSDWMQENTYHLPNGKTKTVCHVCMAGAVMAKSLKLKVDKKIGHLDPTVSEVGEDTNSKLESFNILRMGCWEDAYTEYTGMFCPPVDSTKLPKFHRYVDYPTGFYKWCRAVAKMFAEIGE